MRRFLLVSRTGRTDGRGASLRDAGFLDVVHQCGVMALFKAHGHREDVEFTAVLMGPPKPPKAVTFRGRELRDLATDDSDWAKVLRDVLSGKPHPGIGVAGVGLQTLIDDAARRSDPVFVLHEKGEPIESVEIDGDPLFVIGDHIGLAKKDEDYVMRTGRRVSLGKKSYLAAACVASINYTLDRRESTDGRPP
ncbi:MAG: tRNA (pseudouridine(54)-N(1))-methyltransferase TrmY [Candidatus Rokuibacteriota bacterium]